MWAVRFKMSPSNKSFNPAIKLSNAINIVMLNVTPIAATSVCFQRAIKKERDTSVINFNFILPVLSIHH